MFALCIIQTKSRDKVQSIHSCLSNQINMFYGDDVSSLIGVSVVVNLFVRIVWLQFGHPIQCLMIDTCV